MVHGPVAQQVEQLFCTQSVIGSIPIVVHHIFIRLAQQVERLPYKQGVGRSIRSPESSRAG